MYRSTSLLSSHLAIFARRCPHTTKLMFLPGTLFFNTCCKLSFLLGLALTHIFLYKFSTLK